MRTPRQVQWVIALIPAVGFFSAASSDGADDLIAAAERDRMAVVAAVAPSVVCIYDEMERGGGSGVLIDSDGHGLTNFHVIAGMLEKRRGLGGLADGTLNELEVLGVDPTGDVAMFRLTGRERFPFAKPGDSDSLRLGDEVLAMGNPFVLSEDHTPTVTRGIVTGLHRYQGGTGQNLIYTDCIQIDASINPGNSGGPLFNRNGEVVGINGRISVNTRGRFNVGFGYAIAMNQIKMFIPTLRAGLLARHGTLQATVEQAGVRDVRFAAVRPGYAADRVDFRTGDQVLDVDCFGVETANAYAGLMGTYPANWPVALRVQREGRTEAKTVRLDPVEPKLGRPFEPDPEVNRRAVRRIIHRFRESITAGERSSSEARTPGRRVRHRVTVGDEKTPSITRTSNLWDAESPLEMWDVRADGALGGVLRFDDTEVRRRSTAGGSEYEPLRQDSLVLASMYVLQRLLPSDEDVATREGVRHVGGDGIRTSQECGGNGGHRPERAQAVEVVVLPILKGAELELAFDPADGGLRRAIARDSAAQLSITIRFGASVVIDGLRRPAEWWVEGASENYRETVELVEGDR